MIRSIEGASRKRGRSAATAILAAVLPAALSLAGLAPAHAQRIDNAKAVFAALDKVTGRISKLEVKLGDTVKFGALKVTPRACYSRPPTEPPKTTSFVEIDEVLLDGKESKIFSGWMFAESPGLNAVEHPVFDVWLTECAEPKAVAAHTPQTRPRPDQPAAADAPAPFESERRFRPRR